MLESLALTVTDVANGDAALELLRAGGFDLLVTDHHHARHRRRHRGARGAALRPAMPAIVISGYADLADIPPELRRLAKPFRVHDLAATVAAARA